ncbi:HTH-type transcriptional repressor NsrR [compost metagenome]
MIVLSLIIFNLTLKGNMFSKSTEYALRATIYIAKKGTKQDKLSIDEIAEAIDSPRAFTAKILHTLSKNKGLINSVSGPNGGFYISEEAKKKSVSVVLSAMGEEEVLERCVLGLNKCSGTHPCPMHEEYKSIKLQLLKLFKSKTIAQLAAEIKDGAIYISNPVCAS